MESSKTRRDTCTERTSLYRFVLCGVAQNVAPLRFKAAAMPSGPPLQARLYLVFQVTNDKLRHRASSYLLSRYQARGGSSMCAYAWAHVTSMRCQSFSGGPGRACPAIHVCPSLPSPAFGGGKGEGRKKNLG